MRSNKLDWFQFYPRDWLSDTQLQRCCPATKGIWIDLVSAMHTQGDFSIVGDRYELARFCRCDEDDIDTFIAEAQGTKFCDVTECNGTYTVTSRRLKTEQDERERVRKAVRKHRGVTDCNTEAGVPCNVDVTSDSISGSDSDLSLTPDPDHSAVVTPAKRATRLPEPFELTDERAIFAQDLGLDPADVLVRFQDYWRGAPGQKGVKADWDATWRNWCRREASEGAQPRAAPAGPKLSNGQQFLRQRYQEAQERERKRDVQNPRANQGSLEPPSGR